MMMMRASLPSPWRCVPPYCRLPARSPACSTRRPPLRQATWEAYKCAMLAFGTAGSRTPEVLGTWDVARRMGRGAAAEEDA